MGSFSWMFSDKKKQALDIGKSGYLLVPNNFQDKYGEGIYEEYYDGYGSFDKYDIFDLVIEWNKEDIPFIIDEFKKGNFYCSVSEDDLNNLNRFYNGDPITCEQRYLGIMIACYDQDNQKLRYPIKITKEYCSYNDVEASLNDPNQGFGYGFDDIDEDYELCE